MKILIYPYTQRGANIERIRAYYQNCIYDTKLLILIKCVNGSLN